ncbi:MAG: Ig-like domain-containing protein, partial [Bacteroidales bacterium]
YISSVIENATPSLLTLTYNLTLANIVPAASAFTVLVNNVARTVTGISVSGTKVRLTLSSPVVNGDVVTVAYTKPASNPLQTSAGGQAASITAQPVTNNVSSVIPVYVSSVIENATPSLLEMTYNMTLVNMVPTASSFSVSVNSIARTVNTVTVSGTRVQLTLASPVVYGDVVTVSYTKPSVNPLQTASGGMAATISARTVSNKTINIAPTAVITSPINNSVFTALTNITITANAIDADGSVTLVEFYSGSTKLGSKSSAPYSFAWNNVAAGTYSLTVIAIDNFNAKTRSSAITVTVNNATPAKNNPPVVTISNPRKGNKYKKHTNVDIDVVATDTDGSISKVELYNGSDKLVELTSAPYSYTWKDVDKGNYEIKAIAIDNLNAATTSSPVDFIVDDVVINDANVEILNLYPNPNNGQFSIEFLNQLQNEKCEIIITDLTGKQVYHGSLLKEETLKQFDFSYFKSGIYIIMIIDNEILVTKKFIKK